MQKFFYFPKKKKKVFLFFSSKGVLFANLLLLKEIYFLLKNQIDNFFSIANYSGHDHLWGHSKRLLGKRLPIYHNFLQHMSFCAIGTVKVLMLDWNQRRKPKQQKKTKEKWKPWKKYIQQLVKQAIFMYWQKLFLGLWATFVYHRKKICLKVSKR